MDVRRLQLTPTQRDIYLEGKLAGEVVNNIGGYQKYFCELDVKRFRRARDLLLKSNDAYHLRFTEVTGGCIPVIAEGNLPSIYTLDFSGEDDPRTAALAWVKEQFEIPFFDIAEVVFQDALIKVSQCEYWYFAKAHHLILDGWGFALQMQRCLQLYEQLASGEPEEVCRSSFVDYMQEQVGYPESPQYAASRDYWIAQYKTLPEKFLDASGSIAAISGKRSRRVSATIDIDLFQELSDLAREEGANIVAVFYAVLYVYFSRAYNCDDIVVCSPVHNRRRAVEKQIIGSVVNVNPHRLSSDADVRFNELVRDIAQLQKRNHRHSRFPIGDLVRELRNRLQSQIGQLSQVSFNYQKLNFQLSIDAALVETHYLSHNHEQLPLTFVVCDYGQSQDVAFHLDYRADLFDDNEAVAILERICGLLRQVTTEKHLEIHRYSLPTESELQKLIVDWNDTELPLRQEICLHEMFEEQALRCPESIAVVSSHDSLTYCDLNERANLVASKLIELGAGPDHFIGVCHSRTPNMLVAILAVLKAGSSYVPIDPAYPPGRIEYILGDAKVKAVLTDSLGAKALPDGIHTILDVDVVLRAGAEDGRPHMNFPKEERGLTAENLAYIIYTSGSTGNPKGVLIEHRNVAAFVQWAQQAYSSEELSAVLAATTICFDLSIFEIFVPLVTGGRVVLVDNILSLRNSNVGEISLINTVPSAIKSLLLAGAIPHSVRCINLAGELLRQDLVDALYELPGIKVYDLYGPSETTTYSTRCLRRKLGRETIGRAISNTQVYVFDDSGNPLPTGIAGELWIGGAGVARGYLNHQALTDEKFVFNNYTNARVYRTGDLVKFNSDGELHYIGRKDNQVKIRGYRVELGEVEARIIEHPAVVDCVVIVREDVVADGNKTLVAYLETEEESSVDNSTEHRLTDSIISMLSESLPTYMVPSLFVYLPELPLTLNGKVNRKILPAPNHSASRQDGFIAPRNDVETKLCEHWVSILKVEDVGVRDNFFALGGDSLLVMQLAVAIEREFEMQLDLPSLFTNATIEKQAKLLNNKQSWVGILDAVSVTEGEQGSSHITL